MDGPILELGIGRLALPAIEVQSRHLQSVGLYDHNRALQCLGEIPTGMTAALTATWPPERGPGHTEYQTETLGAGVVIASRVGRCVNFVGIDGGGLNREALGRIRRRRVRLDLRLIVTACECSRDRIPEAA